MATTDPIRDKKQLKKFTEYFLKRGELRNYVLVIFGIYTALRISDLLNLKWSSVYDESTGQFRTHLTVIEQKTGKEKTIALNKQVIAALKLYQSHSSSEYIFASRKGKKPIGRVQAWRIVHTAAVKNNLDGNISCHSLRKTWGYHAWQNRSISPVVIMNIYNHSNYETTKRYLGVAQDDLDKAYLGMELVAM